MAKVDISNLKIESLQNEEWRDVLGHEGMYIVSNMGRVISFKKKPKLLTPHFTIHGYYVVSLPSEKGFRNKSIHRLVCNAFLGVTEKSMQVNHKNGLRNDNRLENLEWCTPSQNTQHSFDYLRGNVKTNTIDEKVKKIEDLEGEIWKKIVNCDGYMISNYGRVKSYSRKSKSNTLLKEKILIGNISKGYIKYKLYIDGKKRNLSQHRLIAIHFIPNPENKPFINHINGVRNDNRIENLEWCTHSENIKHSFDVLNRKIQNHIGVLNLNGKKVAQYNLNGYLIETFMSFKDAERKLKISASDISSCANGFYEKSRNGKIYLKKSTGGFMFKIFENEPLKKIEPYIKSINLRRSRAILVFDLKNNLIGEFTSSAIAAKELGLSETCIRRVFIGNQHQHKGYTFKYK